VTSPRAVDRDRRALRGVSDRSLIDAMRDDSPEAWEEFMRRFRPLLERYGRRMGMSRPDWDSCVITVLEDAAMRWAIDGAPLPRSMASYLLRAVSFHRMTMEREAGRRARRHLLAGDSGHHEGVILSLCSEAAVRDSYGPSTSTDGARASTLARFCQLLREPLTELEEEMLSRLGDGLPHREIAALLGVSYEAARKRIQRLVAKVRERVPHALEQLSADDRKEVERLLRRLHAASMKGGNDDAV